MDEQRYLSTNKARSIAMTTRSPNSRSWLRQWHKPRNARRKTGRIQLQLEALEDRQMPSIVPLSSPIDVTTGQGGQSLTTHRTVAEAANGDYRVVWENAAQGTTYGLYTQLFDASGQPKGNLLYLANTGVSDSEATIAMNASGAAAIAWTHTTGTSSSVMLERLDTAGTPAGSPITVQSAFAGGRAHQPSVAMDTAGDIALAYTDSAPPGKSNNSPISNQVKGTFISAGGTLTPITVTPQLATSQPSVAMNTAGNFVVAFTRDASSSNQDVYVQPFNLGGAPEGTAIVVANSSQSENQPSAAIDVQGDFVVAYTYIRSSQPFQQAPFDNCTDYQSEVYAVLYDSSGNLRNTETVWKSSKITENAYDPSAAMDAVGNFVIGYTRGGNLGGYVPSDGAPDVWAVAYKSTGAVQQADINLSVNSLKPASGDSHGPYFVNNYRPSVALSPSGHLAADWENFGLTYNGEVAGTAVFTQTFVNAPFQYQLPDSIIVPNIWGGMPASYHIAITRDPGFTGPIAISFANLPPGITASVSPDSPAPTEVFTVTFTSDDAVPPAVMAKAKLQISGGNVTLTPTVYFNVTPSAITGWASGAGSILVEGSEATIVGSGFVPLSTVNFGPNLTVTPDTIDPNGRWLTVVVPHSTLLGKITILRPGGESIVSATMPQYVEPGITHLSTTVGYAPGYSRDYLQSGSYVIIQGYGFQQGTRVIFGDPQTTDPAKLKTLAGQVAAIPAVDPSGTQLSVTVPPYAINGPITILQPDGTVLQSADAFTVNNYRNTFGFGFENFDFHVGWQLVKNEFGAEQVDVYGPHPQAVWYPPFIIWEGWDDLGIPTPLATLVWGIMKASFDDNGACFGMALTSILMSAKYHPDWINADNGLPGTAPAATVFNLLPTDNLTTLIEQDHLAQLSGEIASYFLTWQASSHTATDIYSQISGMLATGDHPIISMQAGAQHSVVAYNLESGDHGDGDFYIDVYDPNRPFNFDATEATDPARHWQDERVSRIHIDPATGWSFTMASEHGVDGSTHSGGYDTLEVIPADLVANHVTFLASPQAAFEVNSFLSGSSGQDAAPRSHARPAFEGSTQLEVPRLVRVDGPRTLVPGTSQASATQELSVQLDDRIAPPVPAQQPSLHSTTGVDGTEDPAVVLSRLRKNKPGESLTAVHDLVFADDLDWWSL
jgi:hypothetical protein